MSGTPGENASPTAEPVAEGERLNAAFTAWRETLLSVKKSIDEATAAVGLLRATLSEMAPLWSSVDQLEKALTKIDWPKAIEEATCAAEEALAKTPSTQPQPDAVSEEMAIPEAEEAGVEEAREAVPAFGGRGRPFAGVDVPVSDGSGRHSYTVTVEEAGTRVKLVPLHQSLNQVKGVRELSLKSYVNGVAVVSVDSEVELEAPVIEDALTRGMQRACRVLSGDGPSFLVRMGDDMTSERRLQQKSAK
jgi:hypothetical protein